MEPEARSILATSIALLNRADAAALVELALLQKAITDSEIRSKFGNTISGMILANERTISEALDPLIGRFAFERTILNRGWSFWRRPLLTKEEENFANAAVHRFQMQKLEYLQGGSLSIRSDDAHESFHGLVDTHRAQVRAMQELRNALNLLIGN